MKKTRLFLLAVLCVTACKEEPDLPDDPHLQLVNPFIGVWRAGDEYWQFRTNGTGGKAASATGSFPDTFSFLVYAGQDVQKAPSNGSLVILEDSGANLIVTRYVFDIDGNEAELTEKTQATASSPSLSKSSFILERVSGAPYPITLTNPFIGEWSATWDGLHDGSNKDDTWSIKYRADGTVKTYHLGVRHQFENAYAVRGNKLVIFGFMRFQINPVISDFTKTDDGKYHVVEKQAYPPPANWNYTKVESAEWL